MSQQNQQQTQAQVFTKDEFIRQYKMLSQSNNEYEKEAANQYILQFQTCSEVWMVAREMIVDPPSQQLQALGAQILCNKLKNHYSQLSSQQKLELRKFLFNVLQQYCSFGNQVISKVAKNQIVHSIAILGFTGIFQDWQTFVEDICAFMRLEGSDEYFICGIEILENVANQENMEKVVTDMKAFQRIRSLFQSQASQLSGIFNTLLGHQNQNVGLKTLDCIESWAGSQFKYQIFLDEPLVTNLIILLNSIDEEVFERVAKIMLEGIKHSNNADILETANVKQSLNLLKIEEVRSLKTLIDALAIRLNDFLTMDQVNPESKFCKYYVEITTEIAQKFSILILENSEHSIKLLQLMVICTQHPNRSISYTTFEFWVSFYRTLKTYVPNIQDPSSDWLIQPYLEVFKTVLEKSKLKKLSATLDGDAKKKQKKFQLLKKYSLFQDADDGSEFGADFSSSQYKLDDCCHNDSGDDDFSGHQPLSFDLDQIDSAFTKIRVQNYRIYARDIFNVVYNVLSQFRGQQGINSLLQILYTLINKEQFLAQNNFTDANEANKNYYISVEVCLFVVQTMAENMFPGPLEGNDENYTYFFDFIVNNNEFPAHQSTVSMAMQLFYNAQVELTKNPQLFDSTIKFILRYLLDDNLGLMSAQTFSGIIKGVGQNNYIETFRFVAQFFVQNINKIVRQDVMDEFIQGVFGFALSLKTEQHQLEAIQNLLQLIQQMLDNTKSSIENITEQKEKESLLLRAIGILQSLLSGFSTEAIGLDVKNSIATFVQQNFEFLTLAFDVLTMKTNAAPLISQFTSIFRYVTKIFNDQNNNLVFYDQYIIFLNTSIKISQRNPILFSETMSIFKQILDLTKNSSYHQNFLLWLEQYFNEYNQFYIKFMTQADPQQPAVLYPQIQLQHQVAPADKNKDPDLITNFYDIQFKVITQFTQYYLNHNSFRAVIELSFDVIKSISHYEMTRSIIIFYYEFIKHCSQFPQTQEYVLKILDTTIDILTNVNSNLIHNISNLFIKFVDINKDHCEQLREYIMKCFQQKEKYSQFNDNQKKILVDCIIKFSLENNNLNQLKSLLSDFYQVYKGIFSAKEMFMNYEMKLKGFNHNNQNNQASQNGAINHISPNFLNQLSNTLLLRNQPIKNASDLDDLFK
ncbi:hypothetical protein TTHERM_00600700 (macronuclear) [Tetrahymena thermophila SB210]|uniref:Importin N-terminal domain-containing protein n=1 Tax=Tetrahymena thermophila (strain SB210) TaxID=312017 RepID=I7MCT1_TETTS|nr:hypothetical protein TTHERM_00600700 [Tetrahymena thermophila SB210]EAR84878.1 hypothetical protein TTHERM_00600700 [Tetrahymena thermophila SB210]|eukprot:XP_001032541.1 hypothetical protein TTHERM_00600700 [Tetrahymena thermophila SB210]